MLVKRLFVLLLTATLGLAGAPAVRADIQVLPSFISHNMVLQQSHVNPIWGWADPGETITVTIDGREKRTRADEQGKWMVQLSKMKAGGPYDMTIAGNNTITIKNILVGEVWVCSGQSNMEWPVFATMNGEKDLKEANYPQIRLFVMKRATAVVPAVTRESYEQLAGPQWAQCDPKMAHYFSGVGFYFGRDLHKALDVPVGLISTSVGGTPAQAWTSRETLEAFPETRPIIEAHDKSVAEFPQEQAKYEQQLAQWQKAKEEAEKNGQAPPPQPGAPYNPGSGVYGATNLYNGMLAPLFPYGIKGAIWYQGESNAGQAYQYRRLFPAMINNWRNAWGQGDFPFLFVQLANFQPKNEEPVESDWAELREAQTMTLALPNTAMAVTIDIGNAYDIHPRNKHDVGKRLSLAAQGIAYDKDVVYSGPIYRSHVIEGNKVTLHFDHVGGGLVVQGEELTGFAIAGAGRKFVWARAKIRKDTINVWHPQIDHPVAVRYGWANNPDASLFNKEGLPASPFRTDDWPGVTVNKQ